MGVVTRRVVTFYSFKGGVGRTFALCDVAVYLARWGYRVLCVDFDLEAPGLDRYFDDWLKNDDSPGVLEILDTWARDASDDVISAQAIRVVDVPATDGRLAVMRSGRRGDDYVRRLHIVDWSKLFDQKSAGRRLEALRERWLEQFDFVLIDSRTGWSDVGAICTIHLPDILVTLFTPNEQSLQGAIAVADASKRGVAQLLLDRAPLRIVPVMTRVDKDEYEAQQQWTERLLTVMPRFVNDWDPQEDTPTGVLTEIVVPYVPYWAYGERLAAIRTEHVSSLSVSRSHETLASLLARGLSEAALLLKHRESYVAGAAVGQSAPTTLAPTVEYDLYLSYPSAQEQLARGLAEELRRRGVTVFFDKWALQPGDRWQDVLRNAQHRSRMFAVLLDGKSGPIQAQEIDALVQLAERRQARFVPVALSGFEGYPESVRQFHGIVAPRIPANHTLPTAVTEALGFPAPEVDVVALAEVLLPLALQR